MMLFKMEYKSYQHILAPETAKIFNQLTLSSDLLPPTGFGHPASTVRDAPPVQLSLHVLDPHGGHQESRASGVHPQHS